MLRRRAKSSGAGWVIPCLTGGVIGLFASLWFLAIRDRSSAPATSAPGVSETDDRGMRGLEMLAMADQFGDPHQRQLWFIAANMAFHGYVTDEGAPFEMDARELHAATLGYVRTSPPENPYQLIWKLNRDAGSPSFLTARSDKFTWDMMFSLERELIGRVAATGKDHALSEASETARELLHNLAEAHRDRSEKNVRLAARSGDYDFEAWMIESDKNAVLGLSFTYSRE